MAAQHVNPDEAVRVHRDLGAKAPVGVHRGNFELGDEALDAPPRTQHGAWPGRGSSCWRSAKLDACRAAAAGRDRDP
jgi:hypothetical protein